MRQSYGFGLIEILVALAVISMLLVVGVFLIQMPREPAQTVTASPEESSSSAKVTDTTNSDQPFKVDYGTSLSPASFNDGNFQEFFAHFPDAGTTISWAGSSDELNDSGSAAHVLFEMSRTNGFLPVIITDSNNQDAVVKFAQTYTPAYIGVGNEVNLLSRPKLNELANDFSLISSKVKMVSPSTVVFPVFQLEYMKGLKGGLFGGVNDSKANGWDLLKLFPKADAIGFTTYPGMIFKHPDELPDDYYLDIQNQTDKPILFTEIGWQSQGAISGWESSPEEQQVFVSSFFSSINNLGPRLVLWSFLYDQDIEAPFQSMGLIDRSGKPKPAYEAWTDEVLKNR